MRVSFLIAASVCLSMGSALGDEPVALRAREFAREAKFAQAVELMPEHPRYLLGLAAAQTAAGRPELAVQALGRIAEMGNHLDLTALEPLAPLREREDFQAVVARMTHLLVPVGRGEVAFTLSDMRGLIEGIAWREKTGDCFFGDVHLRAIWRRAANGVVTRFDAGDARMLGVFGLEVDEARGALWAATSALPEMRGFSTEMKGRAGVAEFDLETGALRRIVLISADGGDHVLGDLLVAEDGSIFATDSVAPVIWRLASDADTLERWVESQEFMSLQGLAFAQDGSAIFVAAYGNGLLRIDRATREVSRLPAPAGATLLGVDGLERADDGALVAVQNGIAPPRVVRVELDPVARAIRAVTVLEAAHATLADPTLITRAGDSLLVIGDAGWRFFEVGRSSDVEARGVSVLRLRVPAARDAPALAGQLQGSRPRHQSDTFSAC
jgi:sugar lactone lactonase YvrE